VLLESYPTLPPLRGCVERGNGSVCHSEPFAFVTLRETKGLDLWLRVNSVKNLMISTESIIEILRLSPQNDITTQSLKVGEIVTRCA
jgi:hypothetical protein